MEDKLLTTGEAAKKIGVSIRTIQRWDTLGILKPDVRLPAQGCAGGRRYRPESIETFKRTMTRGK